MSTLRLVIVDGPDAGREFDLAGVIILGRDPSVGIVLADSEVSRRHASLNKKGDGALIEDLGSLNGTFVNGERIQEGRALTAQDKFRVGNTVFQLRAAAPVTRVASRGRVEKKEALQIRADGAADKPQTSQGNG